MTASKRHGASKPVDVAVIGLGMGRHHAHRFHDIRGSRLVALVDADPGRLDEFRGRFGVQRCYRSAEELFADGGVDAVSVALPNDLHSPVSLAALRAGCHVLVEKPMAMNAREAWRMNDEARDRGRVLMVHFNQRFDSHSQYFRRLVERGDLGDIYFARTGWRRALGIPGGWFSQKTRSGGGPLIDLGVHMLDVTRWIMGNPAAAAVSARTSGALGRAVSAPAGRAFDVEDFACAMIRFDTGAVLDLEVTWALNTADREGLWIEIYGTRGSVVFRTGFQYDHPHLAVVRLKGGHPTPLEKIPALPKPQSPQDHFIRAIRNGRPAPASGREGAEIMEILDAIYRSAAAGREVVV